VYPWLRAPAAEVPATARTLLGWHLSAGHVTVRLTEVEAYAGTGVDPASHAHRGPTPRNAVMFGPAGFAYTYFVFGMHWCLNIVCGQPGEAAAVLVRAGEVVAGVDAARSRRSGSGAASSGAVGSGAVGRAGASGSAGAPGSAGVGARGVAIRDRDLARGPARLVVALGVDRDANGTSMIDGTGPLLLTPPSHPVPPTSIASGPRVGVAAAHDVPWRFWIDGDPTVSPYRRHAPRRTR
jgi:DNA-3-methyladenine glycosylase